MNEQNPYAAPATMHDRKPSGWTFLLVGYGILWLFAPVFAGLLHIALCCVAKWLGRMGEEQVIRHSISYAQMAGVTQAVWLVFNYAFYMFVKSK